jgi:gluconolactonase
MIAALLIVAASVDLTTTVGAGSVKAQWRYSDARVVETVFRAAGPDGQPGAVSNNTYDVQPHAGGVDYDDSQWPAIAPESLADRRGNGRVAFNWYRVNFAVPESAAGSTVMFEVSVDDYAEVWVDGALPLVLGASGGQLVKGFNAPNRVVLTRDARPGQRP